MKKFSRNNLTLLILTLVIFQSGMLDGQTRTYHKKFESKAYLKVHVLFTNDLHGGIAPSKAWFMNPEFPPDLGGGASMYRYAQEIRAEAAAEGAEVLLLDGGNIFQGTPPGYGRLRSSDDRVDERDEL